MNAPVPVTPESRRQWVSDLADGRLDAAALDRACRAWADDAEARRAWHAYHLIGDVLRSEDLAADARHDAAFLEGFRQRLAAEPVVMAPVRRRHPSWLAPVAAAAGFVAVAGVVVVLRQAAPVPGAGPQMAQGVVPLPVQAQREADARHQARVQAYLRAHREAFAGAPAALPGGGVRTVEYVTPQR
jgi:sigma-E factor negative regulatory protein RseA